MYFVSIVLPWLQHKYKWICNNSVCVCTVSTLRDEKTPYLLYSKWMCECVRFQKEIYEQKDDILFGTDCILYFVCVCVCDKANFSTGFCLVKCAFNSETFNVSVANSKTQFQKTKRVNIPLLPSYIVFSFLSLFFTIRSTNFYVSLSSLTLSSPPPPFSPTKNS